MKAGEVDAIYPGQPITSMHDLLTQHGIKHRSCLASPRSTSTSSSGPQAVAPGGLTRANAAFLLKKNWFNQALGMGLNRQPVINAVYNGVLDPGTVKPLNNPFYTGWPAGDREEVPVLRAVQQQAGRGDQAAEEARLHGRAEQAVQQQQQLLDVCRSQGRDQLLHDHRSGTLQHQHACVDPAGEGDRHQARHPLLHTAQPDFFTNLLPTGNFDLAE